MNVDANLLVTSLCRYLTYANGILAINYNAYCLNFAVPGLCILHSSFMLKQLMIPVLQILEREGKSIF